jgi:signal transduction histidine kinase
MPSDSSSPDNLAQLRQRAEKMMEQRRTEASEPLNDIAQARLVQELGVHQIELEMQNEEMQSARLQMEELLSNYTELYDFAPSGYFTIDNIGTVLQANLSGALLLDLDRSRLVGSRFALLLDPTERSTFNSFLRRVFYTGELQRCDVSVDASTREHPLHLRLESKLAEKKLKCRVVAVDVTRLKESESRLRELNEQMEQKVLDRTDSYQRAKHVAEEANAAKTRFLSVVSHEIHTPMNGIIGMTDMLGLTELNDQQKGMVELIRESADSLLGIMNEILDFSKIEAEKIELNPVPTNIAELAEHLVRLLESEANKKAVKLAAFIDPLLPKTIICDCVRLRQVLLNLIGNAIKFSSTDGRQSAVQLRVNFESLESDTGMLEIEIVDNGFGMDPETQERVFSPFVQANPTTKVRYGGTGLGLPISRSLVNLMGGELSLQSSRGKGSTFTIRMNVKTLDEDAVNAEEALAGTSESEQ